MEIGKAHEVVFRCSGTLASHYNEIIGRVLGAIQELKLPVMGEYPILLTIQSKDEELFGARKKVETILFRKFGVKLMNVSFERLSADGKRVANAANIPAKKADKSLMKRIADKVTGAKLETPEADNADSSGQ